MHFLCGRGLLGAIARLRSAIPAAWASLGCSLHAFDGTDANGSVLRNSEDDATPRRCNYPRSLDETYSRVPVVPASLTDSHRQILQRGADVGITPL